MVCKTISSKFRRPQASAGLSLVEFMFGIAVGSVVITAVVAFSMYTGRGFAGTMNYVQLESQSRSTLDQMTREIRQTLGLTNYTSNLLSFVDYDGALLTYQYNPAGRTLTRTKNGASKTLLTGCDNVTFAIYQRNTTNQTFDQFPTSLQASNCKVVQLNWTCSRTITGTKLNTETVQSMKVVVRQQ